MFVPSFKILRQVVPKKSLTENFAREKEKWTNKGLINNMWLFFFCFFFSSQYNSSLTSFVLSFRILSQVVAEKSLNEKKVYKQTNIFTRAFSPYHQGPIKGPVPNQKYPPFFPISKKKSQFEVKKKCCFSRILVRFVM